MVVDELAVAVMAPVIMMVEEVLIPAPLMAAVVMKMIEEVVEMRRTGEERCMSRLDRRSNLDRAPLRFPCCCACLCHLDDLGGCSHSCP